MPSDVDLRAEAERLVDLDDRGRLIEAVTVCLRVGEQSSRSMESLQALDMAMVDWVRGDSDDREPPSPQVRDGGSGDGGIGQGGEVSAVEPVGT